MRWVFVSGEHWSRRWLPVLVLPALVFLSALGKHAAAQAPAPVATCVGCHKELTQGVFVHGPAAVGDCLACHKATSQPHPQKGKATFTLKVKEPDLCAECHERKGTKPVVHAPVLRGKCTGCHDPHRAANKFGIREVPIGKVCLTCHDRAKVTGKAVHGPVAMGDCNACHDPHESNKKFLLIAEGNALCFTCHAEKAEEFKSRRFAHAPAQSDCQSCHDPHASANPAQVRAPMPELCINCHASIGDRVAKAAVKHGAVSVDRQCANCHDPHTSTVAKQLKAAPMENCLSCHSKPMETPAGKIANVKALLDGNPNAHGPIRQKDCGSCHEAHGSSNFRLLRQAYPRPFYAPFDVTQYGLCFACHQQTLVLDRQTTTLTGFRNGPRNLHFLHVNKWDKGRTCRACHETHASRRPKHIREGVPFGKWEIPINFEVTRAGGRCAPGCHAPFAYDREQPVAYSQ